MTTMKRSAEELQRELLDRALEPIKPTTLMYISNMSWVSMNRHLNTLEELGLITRLDPTPEDDCRTKVLLQTTAKGVAYLKMIRDTQALLNDIY